MIHPAKSIKHFVCLVRKTYTNICPRKSISELRIIQFLYLHTSKTYLHALINCKYEPTQYVQETIAQTTYCILHVIIASIVHNPHSAYDTESTKLMY